MTDRLKDKVVIVTGAASGLGAAQARVFARRQEIGRAHVCTPVTNAQHVCRLLLEKTKKKTIQKQLIWITTTNTANTEHHSLNQLMQHKQTYRSNTIHI